ncbi:hypothetical protein BTL50_11525 [Bordetella holmesii]|uniref:Tripartite tricarboxylate transporter family receptor n=5 Tax=Bordetella holmesii TaxID=35814 RepID=A0A158M7J4_9BORD|nr:hypothetical protein H558_17635 [Bordetella holmesii H558]AOB36059.1 hypothetical protein BBB42_11390 [Bordetella holmesii]EWM41302.1 tripartite tricarboxylate transporter receptor family protein [Bordetella holmesii 35009]EWM43257.1 tripartite tricarboxylate transporter receptor family protein [Bordetella holmesii 41130]EXF88504.1 tripartite tricarboxylate transporter receptor family protein [Bordetella holmesii 30539]EXX94507.1 tripartite tricarboxylate transporter receptor family protein
MLKRSFLSSALFVGALGMTSTAAAAWPQRQVTLIVPFAAGGAVDSVARALAARMSEGLGQTVVVENRTGASGMIGADYVAKSKPDGYTLLMGTQSTLAVGPLLMRPDNADPSQSFAGAGMLATAPLLLVANPAFPAKTVAELVAKAKREPGKIDYGSGGVGSTPHMAGELLGLSTGTKLSHIVYKGEQPALTDVMGNQIPIMFSNLQIALPLVQSGRLKALAISTAKRSPAAPDVPTIAETVAPGFDAATWFGVVAPKATPPEVIARLGSEIEKAANDPALRKTLEGQGITIQQLSPAAFDAYIRDDYKKWQRVIKDARITMNRPGFLRQSRSSKSSAVRTLPEKPGRYSCGAVVGCRTTRYSQTHRRVPGREWNRSCVGFFHA